MEVKNFVMMAVTLIIGVILVAGVLTPVIANAIGDGSGSDNGPSYTNEGTNLYSKTPASGSLSIYPVYISETDNVGFSYTNPYFDDNATIYPIEPNLVGPDWWAYPTESGDSIDRFGYIALDDGDDFYDDIAKVIITGTTIQFQRPVAPYGENDLETVATFDDLLFYPDPNGDYVLSYTMRIDGTLEKHPTYVTDNTEIFAQMWVIEAQTPFYAYINGTVTNNTVVIPDNYTEWVDAINGPASFTIEDGLITSVSITVNDTEYSADPSLDDNSQNSVYFIVPINVGGSSGGSGSLSPTLTSLLTVVPILVLAGLVIMTVMYFRRA